MEIRKWLTISSRGAARLTQGKPTISWNEVSILLNIDLPDALFKKPRLEAKIEIPEEAVGPDCLSSEVVENVQEAIEQATGLNFSINVIKSEEKENENN